MEGSREAICCPMSASFKSSRPYTAKPRAQKRFKESSILLPAELKTDAQGQGQCIIERKESKEKNTLENR